MMLYMRIECTFPGCACWCELLGFAVGGGVPGCACWRWDAWLCCLVACLVLLLTVTGMYCWWLRCYGTILEDSCEDLQWGKVELSVYLVKKCMIAAQFAPFYDSEEDFLRKNGAICAKR